MNIDVKTVGPACSDVTVTVRRDDLIALAKAAAEAADEIEAEVMDRYPSREHQPVQERRYWRDMQQVIELRKHVDAIIEING